MDNMFIYTGLFGTCGSLNDEEKEFATNEFIHLLVQMEVAQVLSEAGWGRTSNGLFLLVGALLAGLPRSQVLTECRAVVSEVVRHDDMNMDAADVGLELMWLYLEDIAGLEQLRTLTTTFGEMAHAARRRVAGAENDYQRSGLYEQAVEVHLNYRLLRAAVLIDSCSTDWEAALGIQMLFAALVNYRGRDGTTELQVREQAAEVIRKRIQWEDVHKAMEARRQAAAKFEGVAP